MPLTSDPPGYTSQMQGLLAQFTTPSLYDAEGGAQDLVNVLQVLSQFSYIPSSLHFLQSAS